MLWKIFACRSSLGLTTFSQLNINSNANSFERLSWIIQSKISPPSALPLLILIKCLTIQNNTVVPVPRLMSRHPSYYKESFPWAGICFPHPVSEPMNEQMNSKTAHNPGVWQTWIQTWLTGWPPESYWIPTSLDFLIDKMQIIILASGLLKRWKQMQAARVKCLTLNKRKLRLHVEGRWSRPKDRGSKRAPVVSSRLRAGSAAAPEEHAWERGPTRRLWRSPAVLPAPCPFSSLNEWDSICGPSWTVPCSGAV